MAELLLEIIFVVVTLEEAVYSLFGGQLISLPVGVIRPTDESEVDVVYVPLLVHEELLVFVSERIVVQLHALEAFALVNDEFALHLHVLVEVIGRPWPLPTVSDDQFVLVPERECFKAGPLEGHSEARILLVELAELLHDHDAFLFVQVSQVFVFVWSYQSLDAASSHVGRDHVEFLFQGHGSCLLLRDESVHGWVVQEQSMELFVDDPGLVRFGEGVLGIADRLHIREEPVALSQDLRLLFLDLLLLLLNR